MDGGDTTRTANIIPGIDEMIDVKIQGAMKGLLNILVSRVTEHIETLVSTTVSSQMSSYHQASCKSIDKYAQRVVSQAENSIKSIREEQDKDHQKILALEKSLS